MQAVSPHVICDLSHFRVIFRTGGAQLAGAALKAHVSRCFVTVTTTNNVGPPRSFSVNEVPKHKYSAKIAPWCALRTQLNRCRRHRIPVLPRGRSAPSGTGPTLPHHRGCQRCRMRPCRPGDGEQFGAEQDTETGNAQDDLRVALAAKSVLDHRSVSLMPRAITSGPAAPPRRRPLSGNQDFWGVSSLDRLVATAAAL